MAYVGVAVAEVGGATSETGVVTTKKGRVIMVWAWLLLLRGGRMRMWVGYRNDGARCSHSGWGRGGRVRTWKGEGLCKKRQSVGVERHGIFPEGQMRVG